MRENKNERSKHMFRPARLTLLDLVKVLGFGDDVGVNDDTTGRHLDGGWVEVMILLKELRGLVGPVSSLSVV